jgi:hypothetical protein
MIERKPKILATNIASIICPYGCVGWISPVSYSIETGGETEQAMIYVIKKIMNATTEPTIKLIVTNFNCRMMFSELTY